MAIATEKKNYFDLLPLEITTTEIFSRVPADSILNCKLVCKTWQSLINHPSFVDAHTRHVFLDDSSSSSSASMGFYICTFMVHRLMEELHLGKYNEGNRYRSNNPRFNSFHFISCNGLIFTGSMVTTSDDDDMLCIYNPFTREYVDLLPSFVSSGISYEMEEIQICFIANGFGYNDSTKEYKIVRIFLHNSPVTGCFGHAFVYTLGSGKWRSKGKIFISKPPNGLQDMKFGRDPGVFANGAIYWLHIHDDPQSFNATILSFDLGDEKFSLVREEVLQEIPCMDREELGVLRGRLCLIRHQCVNGKISADIWIAKNKAHFSWTRKFNVPLRLDHLSDELDDFAKGDKIWSLFSYDIAPFLKRYCRIPYTKSFVSLKGLGEEDAKCMDMPTSIGSRTERGESSSNGGEGPINVQREDRGVQRGGRRRGGGISRGQSSTSTARFVSADSSPQHFMRPPPIIPPAQVLRPPWRVTGSNIGRGHFGGGGAAINTTGGNTGRGQMGPIGVNRSTRRGRGNDSSSSNGRG